MNILVHILWCTKVYCSIDLYLRVKVLHYRVCKSALIDVVNQFSRLITIFYSHKKYVDIPVVPHAYQHLIVSNFFSSHPHGIWKVPGQGSSMYIPYPYIIHIHTYIYPYTMYVVHFAVLMA